MTEPGAPPTPGFGEALRYWLRLGFISFGGPAGQIAIMHHELVDKRRWISEQRFLHALNYCMVLPGPEAQQLATYIGWLLHGTAGGIAAGVLFVAPSLLLLIALSWVYIVYGTVPVVAAVLAGIKPAVTAVVLFAAWRIGTRTLRNPWLWTIALFAFLGIFALRLPFPLIILLAALAGVAGGRLHPAAFALGGLHSETAQMRSAPAVIDDASPPPRHARYVPRRLLLHGTIGLAIWALAMLLLWSLPGDGGVLPRMAGFFTSAALLTFGGAYAVLPYVYQAAVMQFGWLSGSQMIDGLALGETTPGPLIMVVAFVGFLGAWQQAALGPEALPMAGIAGATVATFFTFLPSFLFILLGGPLVEATHGKLKFTAPLTGVTAAVVGVIVNLAVFFAYHVLWPRGFTGDFNVFGAVLTMAALLALFRLRMGIIPVILLCGVAGLLAHVLGA